MPHNFLTFYYFRVVHFNMHHCLLRPYSLISFQFEYVSPFYLSLSSFQSFFIRLPFVPFVSVAWILSFVSNVGIFCRCEREKKVYFEWYNAICKCSHTIKQMKRTFSFLRFPKNDVIERFVEHSQKHFTSVSVSTLIPSPPLLFLLSISISTDTRMHFFYLIAAGVLLLLLNVISHSRTTKQNTRRCCLPNSTGNCYFKLFYEYWLRIGSRVVPCFFPCFRFVKLDSQQFVFTFVWDVCFESAGTQFSRSLQIFFSILQGTTASKTFL